MAKKAIHDFFYFGVTPKSEHHKSSHTIKVELEEAVVEKDLVITDKVAEQIYRARCKDCNLNFDNMKPQFEKFKQYCSKKCINKKIVINDHQLSLNTAKFFADFISKPTIFGLPRISQLNLRKNLLRDPGVIELSKCLSKTKYLVSLDLASNEITPKGIKALSQALSENESLASLNLETLDGFQRNRLSTLGG